MWYRGRMDFNSPVTPESTIVQHQEFMSLFARHAPAFDVHEILLGKVQYDEEALNILPIAISWDVKVNTSRNALKKQVAERLEYVMSEKIQEYDKG